MSSLAMFHDVTGLQLPLATLPSSGSQKKALAKASAFFNEINPLRDL